MPSIEFNCKFPLDSLCSEKNLVFQSVAFVIHLDYFHIQEEARDVKTI